MYNITIHFDSGKQKTIDYVTEDSYNEMKLSSSNGNRCLKLKVDNTVNFIKRDQIYLFDKEKISYIEIEKVKGGN